MSFIIYIYLLNYVREFIFLGCSYFENVVGVILKCSR